MGQQFQYGTQNPMRPSFAILSVNAAPFNIPDNSGTVDWTVAGTRVPLNIVTSAMLVKDNIDLGGSNFLKLDKGQWQIDLHPVVHALVGSSTVQCAVTSATGATVYGESPEVTIPAASNGIVRCVAYVEVTADGTDIMLRLSADDADMDLIDDEQIATVTKIGNVNEA